MNGNQNNGKGTEWYQNLQGTDEPPNVTMTSVNHDGSGALVDTTNAEVMEFLKELYVDGEFRLTGIEYLSLNGEKQEISVDEIEEEYGGEPVVRIAGQVPSHFIRIVNFDGNGIDLG